MNNLDKQYHKLLKDILDIGVDKMDRTGTGTLSVFGRQITHNMSDGFPLLTTKKMAFKTMVTELLWFLKGDTNIKYLVDNGCNIWNGDAYKRFDTNQTKLAELTKGTTVIYTLTESQFIERIKTDDEFAKKWGELGPIYGKQWRKWGQFNDYTDQIQNLINDLKTNPDSRRLMVNAWNVGEIDQMTLPPCHYGFQVYTRKLSEGERYKIFEGKGYEFRMNQWSREEQYDKAGIPKRTISLMWNQRSVDTFLGLPFNIASYGLLLEIIAKEVNMVPDELIGNLGDVHLYKNHIEQAKEQMYREPMKLPKLNELPNYLCMKDDWECYKPSDFTLDNYQSHPAIKAPLSN